MKGVQWLGVLASACCVIMTLGEISLEKLEVDCGMENMQVVIPKPEKRGSKQLKILTKAGGMSVLQSDPSCGLWVTWKADGSVIIGATYEGCYVQHMGPDFVMTLGFPVRLNGKKDLVKKEVKCSMEMYQDPPSQDQCDAVHPKDRLSCVSTEDSCATMNCCYDPSDPITPCYFGNAVTARCTSDGLFYIAVANTVITPNLDLNRLQLLDGNSPDCKPAERNGAFILFRFPLSTCGTIFQVTGDQAVYENELMATETVQMWNGISITRDTSFRLRVRCSYSVSGFLPLKVDVATLPPPPAVSSEGLLRFQMRIGLNRQYSDYYQDVDYPVVRVLREPVYAEVRLLGSVDPSVILVLHQCWATPNSDPYTASQWPILVSGCPFDGDNYMTELETVVQNAVEFPSHYSRFSVKTFVFIDTNSFLPLSGEVYLHCSASACVPSPSDSCKTACSRRKRSSINLDDSDSVLVSSDVPIYFETSLQVQTNLNEINGIRLSQPETQTNIAVVTMSILGFLFLMIFTWTFHRQRRSKSVLISKLPSEKSVHIRTVSSELAK